MSNERFASEFAAEVEQWRARGLGRTLVKTLDRTQAPASAASAASGVDFTSNDYLGLGSHPSLIAGAVDAVKAHGTSGRASRLLGGGSPETVLVERDYADWLGTDSALVLPSGYQANVTLLPAIAGRGDVIVSDELNHASLIDAMKLSGATVRIYRHGDVEHAEELLREVRGAARRYLVTESVFSMDGDLAPLVDLERICSDTGTGLIVDEAHGIGVIGDQGRGGCHALGVEPLARIITGGKALGAAGGLILGPAPLMDLIVHRGRGFVFSTAISPAVIGALRAALPLVAAADDARARLRSHATAVALAVGAPAPDAAIVPVRVGEATAAVKAQATLGALGLDVRAVRPPTVPRGTARLRIVCRASHTRTDVTALCDALGQANIENNDLAPAGAAEGHVDPSRPLFIVGTDTDIGKTVVSAAAVLALNARYWKPVQTGDDSDTQEVERLAGPFTEQAGESSRSIAPPRYAFALPASPHTAAAVEGGHIDVDELERALEQHRDASAPTRLVAEFAGGLHVPLNDEVTQADWLARRRPSNRGLDVLLVARSSLGTLNHTLLTLEALRARGVRPKALVLVGDPHAANAETLRPHVPQLFELPHFEKLDRAALVDWLATHDLQGALDG